MFLKLFLLFVGFELVVGNDVKRVDVYTTDCEDCGMTVLGPLSIKVS
jgi:hypothetical protein